MASSTVTLKFSSTLLAPVTSGSGTRSPDSYSLEFTSKKRIEKQVRTIAAGGTLTITKADEGFTTLNFVKVEGLTAGVGFNIAFDGDASGSDFSPPSSTTFPLFIGTTDFTTMVITNLDGTSTLDIAFSAYEKES